MACVGQRAMAEAVQLKQESRREAALHPADEATIEPGENVFGFTLKLGKRANCADDKGDVHRRFETFSADIADGDKGGCVVESDDLEEVAADLVGGMVGASYGVARNLRDRLRDHDSLYFARRFQLILDLGLLLMISHRVSHECMGKGEEKQRVEHFSGVDAGACELESP